MARDDGRQGAPYGPRGFSLVEIAAVLVVIGLLLGAALTGRGLIGSAEYAAFERQLRDHRDAFRTFRRRYDALPGDLARADARFGLAGANGDGDGVIGDGPACSAAGDESCLAWRHLRGAGLTAGDAAAAGAAARPTHPYEGAMAGIFTGKRGNARFGHKLMVTAVPAEVARRLDRELDDGRCDTGRIAGATDCAGDQWPPGESVDLFYSL